MTLRTAFATPVVAGLWQAGCRVMRAACNDFYQVYGLESLVLWRKRLTHHAPVFPWQGEGMVVEGQFCVKALCLSLSNDIAATRLVQYYLAHSTRRRFRGWDLGVAIGGWDFMGMAKPRTLWVHGTESF